MRRREYLKAATTAPFLTGVKRLNEPVIPAGFKRETGIMFWYYVYSSIERGRVMCTKRSREFAVSDMNLSALTDRQARRTLQLANDGEITLDDIPDDFRRLLIEYDSDKN